MRVPFADLHTQYLRHKASIDAGIADVIRRSAYISGEFAARFEREFAEAAGVRHCVSVGNGTDALYIVLRMLGIGPGHEVITTAVSWIATSEVITQTGARPVFVDVDEYFNLDSGLVAEKINDRTRAVIAVHLYGQAAEVERLASMCRDRDIQLIEDCAQAHLAERVGLPVGTFGVAGTFSFYPGKNLGAYGDAGAIVTSDSSLAERCRMFANHGSMQKHRHEIEGINSRMDGIQAAVLLAKLPALRAWTEERRRIAARYNDRLRNIEEVKHPAIRAGSTHVFHLYVIKVERRDQLQKYLREQGIDTQIHYPTALPLLPAYSRLEMTTHDIPRAATNQSRILSLPLYPELSDNAVDYVCDKIEAFYSN